MMQNPLRTDYQAHYERIVAEYNREKDRVTIEKTFEALMKFVSDLDAEEKRAMREGLDAESLAIFDLLAKGKELGPRQTERIKKVSTQLLTTLKAEKLRMDHWPDKQTTRDAVLLQIRDYLYSDETGLPVESYSEEEVSQKTAAVFEHVFRVYPTLPSPFFEAAP